MNLTQQEKEDLLKIYAGQAMQAQLSSTDYIKLCITAVEGSEKAILPRLSKHAVEHARVLIAELEKVDLL